MKEISLLWLQRLLLCSLCALLLSHGNAAPVYAQGSGIEPDPELSPCLFVARPVAAADWDNDGDLDFAMAMSIATQNGQSSGGWLNLVRSNVDANGWIGETVWEDPELLDTRSLAWGDWDGDGDPDLAVGIWEGPVRVYENTGDGIAFDPANGVGWRAPQAMRTASVAWGDVDGDGDLDLAVGNYGEPSQLYENHQQSLHLDTAKGLGWQATTPMNTGSVAWGDWDGDGDLDLALGNFNQLSQIYEAENGTLHLDPGQGMGWEAPVAMPTTSVAWGDWDNDLDLDLAFGNISSPNAIFENDNGTLTFDPENGWGWIGPGDPSNLLSKLTCSVAFGDFNGDSWLDLVVANTQDVNMLYQNDGTTLNLVNTTKEKAFSTNAILADFNQTLMLDVVIGNYLSAPVILWQAGYATDGTLPLEVAQSLPTTGKVASVAWGDWDGDRDLDLALGYDGAAAQIYENDAGTLKLDPAQGLGWQAPTARNTTSVAWGDWEGDGDLDLALANKGQPSQVYEFHDGTLQLNGDFGWESPETAESTRVAWSDWDGDGDLELAVANRGAPTRVYEYDQNSGTLVLDVAQGFGWEAPAAHYTNDLSWGDWDGDGDADLVLGHNKEPVELFENTGGDLKLDPAAGWGWRAPDKRTTTSVAWGDWNGDGDLDLVVGNTGQMNQIYDHRDGDLVLQWDLPQTSTTTTLAWGDWEGDGDLDLLIGSLTDGLTLYQFIRINGEMFWFSRRLQIDQSYGVNQLALADWDNDGDLDVAMGRAGFENITAPIDTGNILFRNPTPRTVSHLVDNPPTVVVSHPQPGGVPLAYATAKTIKSPTLPIDYVVSDPEGDPVRMVRAYYSLNGGGAWFPATPAEGTETRNLEAAPEGTSHTFVWNAAADIIRGDNVMVRIEVYQGFDGPGPYQWPFAAAQTLPFRIEAASTYLNVTDEARDARQKALVYVDGQLLVGGDGNALTSDQAGLVPVNQPVTGKQLVALYPVYRQETTRTGHSGWVDGSEGEWAYQIYLTNLTLNEEGEPQAAQGVASGEQQLVLRQSSPLVLFNLVVSVEWDATPEYLAEIEEAVRSASNYLYDFTDGQMAFGQVTIYENGEQWANADIQIATKNIVRPHAYVGGIVSPDTSHVIRIGRGWDGNSGNEGPWNQPSGYRTLAHEFGHYALHLYDEYFSFVFDGSGRLTGEAPAWCTGPENRVRGGDATNASVMDYQYSSSELSARDVPGMWSTLCTESAQWQLNEGESAWDTVARIYGDKSSQPKWQMTTPLARGEVMPGPTALPAALLPFPVVKVVASGEAQPPLQLHVADSAGEPFSGALVALYKQDGRVIGQGISDAQGQLTIFGASAGDTVRVASFDGGMAGKATVGAASEMTLQLTPISARSADANAPATGPYLRLIAEPAQSGEQVTLLVSIENAPDAGAPEVLMTLPGTAGSQSLVLGYSASEGRYTAQPVSFSAGEHGTGRIRIFGSEEVDHLQSSYRLQQVSGESVTDIYSDDGNLSLHLAPGSVPAASSYFIIMPPGGLPGPLPAGFRLAGDLYDITASGALVSLEKPGLLRLYYDKLIAGGDLTPTSLVLYHWDASLKQWQPVASEVDEEHHALVASVSTLGTYALLVAEPRVYMPSILTP